MSENRFYDDDMDWLSFVDEPPKAKDFDPAKHPKDELGRWTETGGGDEGGSDERESSGKEGGKKEGGKGGEKKVKELSDFTKADIGMYYHPDSKEDEKIFIDTWNNHFDRTPSEFKTQFLGNGAVKANMTVEYSPYDNSMTVDTNWRGGGDSGKIKSTFYFDEKRVHMDYYRLPESDQGHGIMKQVMAQQMQIWKDAGIEKVDLYANIDVGGHAWARYGFEPLDNVWGGLSSELESRIERLGTGEEGADPDAAQSWDELSPANQNRVESSWRSNTFEEFHESEIQSWRDSGAPLDEAKSDLVGEFNTKDSMEAYHSAATAWAKETIESYLKEREKDDDPVPYTAQQLLGSMTLLYKSDGEGNGDFEVNFNDDKLSEPKNLDTHPALPGMPNPEPHEYLTETMRDEISDRMETHFNVRAERQAENIEAPSYLRDNVGEFQDEAWDSMSDEQKFDWAESNRPELFTSMSSRLRGSGQIPKAEEDVLLKAANSSDPKALWIIADSKWGKELLLDRLWDGKMDLNDKLAMERFNAYVSGSKKTA